MSDEQNSPEPLRIEIVKPKKNKKVILLVIGFLVVIGGSIGGYFVLSKPAGIPTPTMQQVEKSVLGVWNKFDAIYATPKQTTNCTYDPTKVVIGYKFACTIYDGQNIGIGTAQVVIQAPTQQYPNTWELSVTVSPNNP